MKNSTFPKTIKELKESDFETLHAMWKYALEIHCGKDSSSSGGKIFKEELGTDFTFKELNEVLSAVAERVDGWILKENHLSLESSEITSNEMIIGRHNLGDTKRLQNRISTKTFERLNVFLDGIPKHDVPKVFDQIISKGLDYYKDSHISYEAEDKERIK